MLRRIVSLLLLLMLATLGMFSGNTTYAQEPAYTLRVLHTNDHHGHLEPVAVGNQMLGGVARRATLINQIRGQGGNTLLVDGGDVFQGTLFFNKYEGQADLYFYNALGYESMALGNHEFDKGQQVLANFARGANFPLLSANTVIESSSPLYGLIQGYVGKDIGGQTVGIIGLTTEETAILSSPGAGISFAPHADAVRQVIAELKKGGVNKIVVLSHLGLPIERQLARSVAGIDLIVGGHTHSPVGNQPGAVAEYPIVEMDPEGHKTIVVTDWEWGKYLGDITLAFDAEGNVLSATGQPIIVDQNVAEDPAIAAKVAEYAAPLAELRAQIVGKTTVRLEGDRALVRTQETNLGNLVADAMLERTRVDGAVLAIMNSGGIRTSIPAGDITMGQILEVLPFGNGLSVLTLTGTQLKATLEHGVSQIATAGGRFPQVAGVRFSYVPDAAVGSRVTEVQVWENGAYVPMNPSASYRVATNDFMAAGGDGYVEFTRATRVVNTGYILADEVAAYITRKGTVSPAVEGRIVVGTSLGGGAPAPGTAVPAPGTAVPAPGTAVPPTLPDTGLPVSLPNTSAPASFPLWIVVLAVMVLLGAGVTLVRRRI